MTKNTKVRAAISKHSMHDQTPQLTFSLFPLHSMCLDIMEDIREECGKFGNITDLKIPRPVAEGEQPIGLEKIFIRYATVDEARNAQRALSGRRFANRTVVVSYLDVAKFENDELE